MLKLLCITAHPDDEAGAFGGTLLHYAERGVETSVICMTEGTAARNRGTANTNEELAHLRRAEFADSLKVLRIGHGEILHYQDSKLDRTDLYTAVGDLVFRIRQIRPHVMMTFGPDGGLTAHLDHAMAGVFATQAFEWAGRPDRYPEQLQKGLTPHRTQKLYYHTADFLLPERPPISQPTVTARIDVGTDRFERKMEAFRKHTTQAPLFEKVRRNLGRGVGRYEMFHLAATSAPLEAKLEVDLFEGVVED
jgi:LmbE family N-acetylglucosaminyl deacetylase